MAKLIADREIASVLLLTLEISESELEVYVAAMNYLLQNADDESLYRICGAERGEVSEMLDSLTELIEMYDLEPVEAEHVA
jgi:hypothetical protein